jgi:hypothetical protein
MAAALEINQPRTWILDLDGTLVVHNSYINEGDKLLAGVREFFDNLSEKDFVIITTARDKSFQRKTINFLKKNRIRFNKIIFNLPTGKRILINDMKPDGAKTAISINIVRDKGLDHEEYCFL